MKIEEPQIKIPESGDITPSDVKKRLGKIETILATVVVAVVIALISVVVAVFGIFLDQMHYNNAAYKEYSERIKSVESTQKVNEAILKQIQELSGQNEEDRQIIIELQKENSKK